eukprot:c9009_g1_i3.p1 GENE.c9009_g1_i3~~c9009_g1_i3.p1  ORF type:complete len:397 (-),score=100.79 c9009_g1_i3:32-1222(-)
MTIHQPASELFELLDRVHLIVGGRTFYFGDRASLVSHMLTSGHPIPQYSNPADHVLKVMNTDFGASFEDVDNMIAAFEKSDLQQRLLKEIEEHSGRVDLELSTKEQRTNVFEQTWYLVKRSVLVGRRDISLYWVRVVMYMSIALLMGSTWYQVESNQQSVQDRFAAYFFGVAFLCFMAVCGIPAFLEERRVFIRERASGCYSLIAYVLSNFFVSTPFVFIIAFAYSAIAYPMMNLRPGADQFFHFLLYIFLALMVAEGLAVTISALIPFFIGALTIVAFFNGFFMIVQGFFVRVSNIPVWWLWGHYLSYQKYSFEALVKRGFGGFVFDTCDQCQCMFPSTQENMNLCRFTGEDVLSEYDYDEVNEDHWVGVLVGMIVFYRIMFYLVLKYRTPMPGM